MTDKKKPPLRVVPAPAPKLAGRHHRLLAESWERALDQEMRAGSPHGWAQRHVRCFTEPQAITDVRPKIIMQRTVVGLIMDLVAYADTHEALYESKIGDDGLLGDHWAQMVVNLRGLLNGETGALDCGTVDWLLLKMLAAEGFDEDGQSLPKPKTPMQDEAQAEKES